MECIPDKTIAFSEFLLIDILPLSFRFFQKWPTITISEKPNTCNCPVLQSFLKGMHPPSCLSSKPRWWHDCAHAACLLFNWAVASRADLQPDSCQVPCSGQHLSFALSICTLCISYVMVLLPLCCTSDELCQLFGNPLTCSASHIRDWRENKEASGKICCLTRSSSLGQQNLMWSSELCSLLATHPHPSPDLPLVLVTRLEVPVSHVASVRSCHRDPDSEQNPFVRVCERSFGKRQSVFRWNTILHFIFSPWAPYRSTQPVICTWPRVSDISGG